METLTSTDYYFDQIVNDYNAYQGLLTAFEKEQLSTFTVLIRKYVRQHPTPHDVDMQEDPISVLIGELYKRFNDIVHGIVYDGVPSYPAKAVTLSDANRYRYDYIMKHAELRVTLQQSYERQSPKAFADLLTNIMHSINLPGSMSSHGRWMQLFRALICKFDTGAEPMGGNGPYTSTAVTITSGVGVKPSQEEATMMADEAKIETRTYINGKNGADMSDDEIFAFIAHLEGEAEKLSKIETGSEKLTKRIDQLKKDARALASYLDGR